MPQNLYDLINNGNLLDLNYVNVNQSVQIQGNLFVYDQGQFFDDVYIDGQAFLDSNVVFSNANSIVIIEGDVVSNRLFQFSDVGNIIINGGSNGSVLTTYGNGLLYWGNGGTGSTSLIANGTSNVSIPSANGNVLISAAGNSNIVIITGNEFQVNNKIANLGNVSNVRIGGGSNADYLRTYGNGTVYFDTLTYEGTGYDVCNPVGNVVTLPVYANGTSTRNIPLIYIGNTVADLWPYGNGSAVANASPGYVANSTAAFTPANSAILNIPTTTASYDNFYKLIDSNTGAASWNGSKFVEITFHFEMYANAANTKVQVIPFIHTSGSGDNQLQTQNQMIYPIAEFPEKTGIDTTFYIQLANTIDKVGMYVRNITASTEVTVTTGSLDVVQIE